MAYILDGKIIKRDGLERLKAEFAKLPRKLSLAIIQIGDNPRSNAYIKQKQDFGVLAGATVNHVHFPEDVSQDEVMKEIERLNSDDSADGIIVQLPIPTHIDKDKVINSILPVKDVDGLTEENVNKLDQGDRMGIIPATARAIEMYLDYYAIPISGTRITILGRSALVGRPTAKVLSNRGGQVSVCHSQTPNTAELTRNANIIISAVGKPKFLGREHVSEGQIVIDVGINVVDGKLVGDVDFDSVKDIVKAITPVPGGVGQVTVYALFENLYKAHLLQKKLLEKNS